MFFFIASKTAFMCVLGLSGLLYLLFELIDFLFVLRDFRLFVLYLAA